MSVVRTTFRPACFYQRRGMERAADGRDGSMFGQEVPRQAPGWVLTIVVVVAALVMIEIVFTHGAERAAARPMVGIGNGSSSDVKVVSPCEGAAPSGFRASRGDASDRGARHATRVLTFSDPDVVGITTELALVPTGMSLSWSPDGSRLVGWGYRWGYRRPNVSRSDVFVVARDGSDLRWLTHRGDNRSPTWSPDGSMIAFVHNGDLATMATHGLPGEVARRDACAPASPHRGRSTRPASVPPFSVPDRPFTTTEAIPAGNRCGDS
jgi:hypothetical protein